MQKYKQFDSELPNPISLDMESSTFKRAIKSLLRMLIKPFFAVAIVSTILVVYCMLINFAPGSPISFVIFSASPILLLWVTYTVIRHGIYHGKELAENEEWGYQDKSKEELWIL